MSVSVLYSGSVFLLLFLASPSLTTFLYQLKQEKERTENESCCCKFLNLRSPKKKTHYFLSFFHFLGFSWVACWVRFKNFLGHHTRFSLLPESSISWHFTDFVSFFFLLNLFALQSFFFSYLTTFFRFLLNVNVSMSVCLSVCVIFVYWV